MTIVSVLSNTRTHCGLITVLFYMLLLYIYIYIMSSYLLLHLWPSTGKPGTTRHPSKKFFFALTELSPSRYWELSKFYHRSLSRSHYYRPNRSLPSAWNNTFLRNRSIYSQYLRTPRCARFSRRRSHLLFLYHSHGLTCVQVFVLLEMIEV